MPDARTVYLQTIDLEEFGKKEIRKAALDRAHDIRQFEIDLYWKRANYFWLLQAAVFAAVGLTWNSGSNFPAILPIGLSALGFVTSFAGWLATKGSKFWQQNWEHQIDMLEAEFEGNLYKTVYVGPAGVGWSLTGISERLAFCFVAFWLLTLVGLSAHINQWNGNPSHLCICSTTTQEIMTVTCWMLAAIGSYLIMQPSTGMSGKAFEYGDDFSTEGPITIKPSLISRRSKRRLMRREPNI